MCCLPIAGLKRWPLLGYTRALLQVCVVAGLPTLRYNRLDITGKRPVVRRTVATVAFGAQFGLGLQMRPRCLPLSPLSINLTDPRRFDALRMLVLMDSWAAAQRDQWLRDLVTEHCKPGPKSKTGRAPEAIDQLHLVAGAGFEPTTFGL